MIFSGINKKYFKYDTGTYANTME